MDICRGGHGEQSHSPISYDDDFGKSCPLCIIREKMAQEIADLKEKIEELRDEIELRNWEIKSLNEEINKLS